MRDKNIKTKEILKLNWKGSEGTYVLGDPPFMAAVFPEKTADWLVNKNKTLSPPNVLYVAKPEDLARFGVAVKSRPVSSRTAPKVVENVEELTPVPNTTELSDTGEPYPAQMEESNDGEYPVEEIHNTPSDELIERESAPIKKEFNYRHKSRTRKA